MGVGTDCVMSVAVKWYPDKQGIASGGMLMGFGMGAMLLSPLVTVLLGKLSWQTTFLILGVVFGVVMLAVALIVKLPPAEFAASMQSASNGAQPHEQKRDYSAVEMIKTRSFQLAFLWAILVSSGGLGLISQAVPAAEEVLSATGDGRRCKRHDGNGGHGRHLPVQRIRTSLCGLVWDKFGYRISFLWISIGFALSMLLCGVAVMLSSFPLIVAGFMLLGLVYGGNMASMAVISSSFFGPKYFGINYAVATLQMIASASAGPLVLATLQTSTGSYGPAFWAFLAVAAAALALSFAIKPPQETSEQSAQS